MVKAYRLLRAIMNTAVKEDEILRDNPCRIKGYGDYEAPERPTATITQVYALATRCRCATAALILVAAFSGLRWGELAALRRGDVDLEAGTVRVPRSWPRRGRAGDRPAEDAGRDAGGRPAGGGG